jgi:hypothetical protein
VLRRNFGSVTGQITPLIEAVRVASGREMTPPFTVDSFAVVVTALVQGLALRVAIEPERVPVQQPGGGDASWDLFATTVTTLFDAITVEAPGE